MRDRNAVARSQRGENCVVAFNETPAMRCTRFKSGLGIIGKHKYRERLVVLSDQTDDRQPRPRPRNPFDIENVVELGKRCQHALQQRSASKRIAGRDRQDR
jgi:hypothetical protein